MDNHPVQFSKEILLQFMGIGFDRIEGDVDISFEGSTSGSVESDDIGEIVVFEVLVVYIDDGLVVAEDVVYITDYFAVVFGDVQKPLFDFPVIDLWKDDVPFGHPLEVLHSVVINETKVKVTKKVLQLVVYN